MPRFQGFPFSTLLYLLNCIFCIILLISFRQNNCIKFENFWKHDYFPSILKNGRKIIHSMGAFFIFTCQLYESTQSKFATQYDWNSGISWIRTKIGFLGEKIWGFWNKNTKFLKLEESNKFDVKYIKRIMVVKSAFFRPKVGIFWNQRLV